MAGPNLDAVRGGLGAATPILLPQPKRTADRACVAMVFAGPPDALSLCFIERAHRPSDPWSGQMAFPGGRASQTDRTAQDVAQRETLEEVGVDLSAAELLGRGHELPMRRAKTDAVLSPFAFYVGLTPPSLRPEPREVAAGYWIELAHLWSPSQITQVPWTHEGQRMKFDGIAHEGPPIWGLTHRVLGMFGEMVGFPLPKRIR